MSTSAAGPPPNCAPSGGSEQRTCASVGADNLDLRRVEEIGLNALQTQRQYFYDGWVLRVSPGKARRARSVNAHFGSTLPIAEKIAYCERLYQATKRSHVADRPVRC